MTSTQRSAVGISAGILVFAAGFWLDFHTSDFLTTKVNGLEFAPYAHVFQQVAGCLLYSGAALAVAATVVRMLATSCQPTRHIPGGESGQDASRVDLHPHGAGWV